MSATSTGDRDGAEGPLEPDLPAWVSACEFSQKYFGRCYLQMGTRWGHSRGEGGHDTVACHHIPRVSAVWSGLSGDFPCPLAGGEAATSKSELIVSVTKGSLFFPR